MTGFESLLTGRVLADRYRVEEVIGRGGMGVVYRGTDERLGREVAVKVITVAGAADPAARERIRARFRHEAASAARLPHHPNVVPVYDYGTDDSLGLDFLVMELLRGEDLAERMASSGPPPAPVAIEILLQAARGLAVGHRSGLIHRDVKPGNIFLVRTSDPDELQVRVLDFGIAKMIAEEDTFTQLTQDGRAPLSPAFASPEQLRGDSRITPASDVFSLGAVAFQLLTGDRPFTEADRNRMGIGLPVPTPSARARNPAVPPGLEAAIQRTLQHDPEARYPHAAAFAESLARLRRDPGNVEAAGFAPAAFTGTPGSPPAGDEITQPADDATLLAPPPGRPPMKAEPEPTPVPAAGSNRPEEPDSSGRWGFVWALLLVALLGGALFAWLSFGGGGGGEGARPLADLADTVVVDSVPPEEGPIDAVVQNAEGLRYLNEGDLSTALEHFRRALENDPENAEYRYNLGYTLHQMGRHDEAVRELRGVVERDPGRVAAYRRLADAELARGDTTAAIEWLQEYVRRSTYEPGREAAERLILELREPQPVIPDPPEIDTVIPPTIGSTEEQPVATPPARSQRRGADRPAPRDTVRLRSAPADTIRLRPQSR